jgi:hypothetical protein
MKKRRHEKEDFERDHKEDEEKNQEHFIEEAKKRKFKKQTEKVERKGK